MTGTVKPTVDAMNEWADNPKGPVALHLRQKLMPVEGPDGVVFPATYAMGQKAATPYSIDELSDGSKLVQIDSLGAQANRMEPLFKRAEDGKPENPLARLVPQVEIAIENKVVSILDAGHRLGDAIVRSSDLRERAEAAFALWQEKGDASGIAKLAPTSLVFGAWDSRGEGAKLPRLVSSVIRAWDVSPIKRSAQYNPPVDYMKLDVFKEADKQKLESAAGNPKSPLAQRGFVHVPAVNAHGGVVVRGGIYRDVTVNLVALRQLGGDNADELRRYILGLALVAAVEPQDGFLRQGCLLTLDPDSPGVWVQVERTGKRVPIQLEPDAVEAYASTAAGRYGVESPGRAKFNKSAAQQDLKDDRKAKRKGREAADSDDDSVDDED